MATSAQQKIISTKLGKWSIVDYAANVVKITFTPKEYATNENITNAVIAKALPTQRFPVVAEGNGILVANNKINISTQTDTNGWHGFSIKLTADEKIFGGGERALPLNRRGYRFSLYNNPWYGYSEGADNLNYSVPFFTSSNGYGIFFDNASKGYADIGKSNKEIFEVGFLSGEINMYVIIGNSYKEILGSYYLLTGTQPLPPRWVMGNFMSRFGYSSEAQTKEILATMQQQQVPVDAIIFDLFWFGDSIKGTLGNLDWMNKTKWPNPKKMLSDFSSQKINSILIAEPFVLKGTKNFDATQQFFATDSKGKPFLLQDFYFGVGGLYDIFRKDAADWIWNNHYKKQLGNGATGWWTDLGEPEKHPSTIMHNLKSQGQKRMFAADEVHNVYGHYWNKMLSENYAKYLPKQRLFHLNRSGFAGSQRYSIFPWSGDVSRSWSGLRAQLPIMLSMSMSGVPYIHADAGGFAGGDGDNELYTRWLQFAMFTPVFRPHGTALFDIDKNAFSFPSEPALIDEPYRTYAKEVVNLRYALMPYNYTLAYKQATIGEPLVAPLYYHFPTDTTAVNVTDEFMWGENILVAPVIEKGAIERKIYLPKGQWYPFVHPLKEEHSAKIVEGEFQQPITISAIPVFVKAGSFIPSVVFEKGANAKSYSTRVLTFQYYKSDEVSSYTLFDDDGENRLSLSTRQFETITIKANPSKGKLLFSVKSNGGNFQGKPLKRNIRLVVEGSDAKGKIAYINGVKTKNNFELNPNKMGSPAVYDLSFDFFGKPVSIVIK